MPYQLESPLSAALGAAGGYLSGVTEKKQRDAAAKRQAAQDAQQAQQIAAQTALAQSQQAMVGKKFDYQQGQDALRNAQTDRAATLADKREAQAEIQQQHTRDIEDARFKYTQDHDTAALKQRTDAANQAHGDRMKSMENAKTAAELRAATTLKAANLRESGENARFGQGQAGLDSRFDRAQQGTESRFERGQAATQKRFDTTQKRTTKTTTPVSREADYTDAAGAIKGGADRDAVVKRYAAKWGIAPDKADALFP